MIVALTWTDNPLAISYNVYRSNGSGYQLIANSVIAPAYTDGPGGLDNSTVYTYEVTAVTADGESLMSLPVTAVPVGPLSAPTGLVAVVS